jgi:hypothetical protein
MPICGADDGLPGRKGLSPKTVPVGSRVDIIRPGAQQWSVWFHRGAHRRRPKLRFCL